MPSLLPGGSRRLEPGDGLVSATAKGPFGGPKRSARASARHRGLPRVLGALALLALVVAATAWTVAACRPLGAATSGAAPPSRLNAAAGAPGDSAVPRVWHGPRRRRRPVRHGRLRQRRAGHAGAPRPADIGDPHDPHAPNRHRLDRRERTVAAVGEREDASRSESRGRCTTACWRAGEKRTRRRWRATSPCGSMESTVWRRRSSPVDLAAGDKTDDRSDPSRGVLQQLPADPRRAGSVDRHLRRNRTLPAVRPCHRRGA